MVPGLNAVIHELGVTPDDLHTLSTGTDGEREAAALRMVASHFPAFERAAAEISARVRETSALASIWCNAALPAPPEPGGHTTVSEPGAIARFFYDHYEAVDRITFPTFYGTNVGQEVDAVAIVRISPDEAISIVPRPQAGQPPRRLGGETLQHFGGFFAREWRAADFLWGQLDGAERLIGCVCAGYDDIDTAERDQFIRDAQVAILDNDANVTGIEFFKARETGALRYERLKKGWPTLLENPPALEKTLGDTIAHALPILGRIAERGGAGLVGKAARLAGKPVLFLAKSAIDQRTRDLLAVACAIVGAMGVAAVWSGAADLAPWPVGLWWRVVHAASVGGRVLGGTLLAGVGGLVWFLRGRMAKQLEGLRP